MATRTSKTIGAVLACAVAMGASPAAAGAITYAVDYDAAALRVTVTAPSGGQSDTFSIFRLNDEGYVWTHNSANRYSISPAAAAAGCRDLVGQFPHGDGFLYCPLAGAYRELRVAGADGNDVFYPGYTNQPVPDPLRVGIDDGPGADIVQSHMAVDGQFQFDTFPIRITAGTGNDQYIVTPGNAQMRVSYAPRTAPVDGFATGRAGQTCGAGVESEGESDCFVGAFVLEGGSGPDLLRTQEGRAVLLGGEGADTLRDGHGGFHHLLGEGGNDRLVAAGPGASAAGDGIVRDELRGGAGVDTADYSESAGAVRVQPGAATNGLAGEATLIDLDVENMTGGDGADVLLGSAGPNAIHAGLGDDFIRAGAGTDTIDAVDSRSFVDDIGCGPDPDTVTADVGFDLVGADCETVLSAPDADGDGCSDVDETEVFGTDPSDPDTDNDGIGDCTEATDPGCLNPLEPDSDGDGVDDGADAFPCDASRSTAVITINNNNGGAGGGVAGTTASGIPSLSDCDRRVAGSRNRDRMLGTGGDDRLLGRRGNDLMRGVGGRDCLLGNTGDDRVVGGASPDRLIGGPGDDVVRSRDGVRDLVKCGAGKADRAVADRIDLVVACEHRRIR